MSNISFSSGYGEYTSGEFFRSAAFELTSNKKTIFSKEFESDSAEFVDLQNNSFNLTEHNFITGEELVYDYTLNGNNSPIKIAPTVISGVSTTILPKKLYAVKKDFSTLQVAAAKTDALLEVPNILNLTEFGTGEHKISSKNPNLNTLITINNVIQDPIISTSSTTIIIENISEIDSSFNVLNPDLFQGGDLIKINDEIMRILSVGIGTTNSLSIERELLGTTAGIHTQNTLITKVKGNYNIVDNFIYFTISPYGNSFDEKSGLTNGSTFSGRVFLRSGKENTSVGPYDNNYAFDYISENFTGKNGIFTLTNNLSNVTGISTYNAIVTINDVFQPPSRTAGIAISGAYNLIENVGISSIVFNGNPNFPAYDVNISEYPRGGIIFSVGSTGGLGYQPLISAGGTAIVSVAGTIQSISIGYSGSGYRSGIQTVNVGVGYSDINLFDIENIGTATISSGIIVSVNITNPGSGYTSTNPPEVYFDAPLSYSNLPLVYSPGYSGVGTGGSVSVVVGQGSSVIDFKLTNVGYGYKKGDVLTISTSGVSGIPTTSNFKRFEIFVDKVFNDDSSVRTLGNLVIFDPIDSLFDNKRKTFPLLLNKEQTSVLPKIGSDIDIKNCLLIFIDNVLQVPGEAYSFRGGSIFTFKEAPKKGSTSTILFYSGTPDIDTKLTKVLETIKIGDSVKIFSNSDRENDQNSRIVSDITSVDIVKTNLYDKQGISDQDEIRPIEWCPQNVDKFVIGSGSTINLISTKDRVIYEPLIHPTSFAISGISSNATEIFVDNVKTIFDNYSESPTENEINIISQIPQSTAKLSAVVSISGTVQTVTIDESGFGYTNIPQISVASPIGVGTTALLTCTLNSSGGIGTVTIVNSGVGYSVAPLIIVEEPRQKVETASNVSYQGDFGVIVGVGTTTLGVYFDLFVEKESFLRNTSINNVGSAITGPSGITTNYYFYVSNSNVGNGLTSLDSSNNVIGIGTTFIDNVYQVNSWKIEQRNVAGVGNTFVNRVTVKVQNNSSLVGISQTSYYGDFSWGRIYNVSKSGISSFAAYSPGITTSTIVQRNNPLKFVNYLV